MIKSTMVDYSVLEMAAEKRKRKLGRYFFQGLLFQRMNIIEGVLKGYEYSLVS